jgi:hypothetical protein
MAASDENYTVAAEFPDSIRLHILGGIDNLGDLHAAAQINKGFYETYQTHELTLMRSILRADRLRNGSLVVAQRSGNSEDKILKQESDKIKDEGPIEGADAVTIMTEDYDLSDEDDEDDLDGIGGIETPLGNVALLNGPLGIDPPRYAEDERGGSSGDAASPTTPRQAALDSSIHIRASPRKPDESVSVHIEEPPMTDEEARRILWPEAIISETLTPVRLPSPGVGEGVREKFRMGDPSFAEALENKTLVITGDKQLRSELGRRIGLLKKEQDGSNNAGGKPESCGSAS